METLILMLLTLCMCSITLVYSILILKKFKKINRLAALVYEELMTKTEPVENKKTAQKQTYTIFNKEEAQSIQLLDDIDNGHTQQITRAEAHLMKILQSGSRTSSFNP